MIVYRTVGPLVYLLNGMITLQCEVKAAETRTQFGNNQCDNNIILYGTWKASDHTVTCP